MLSRSTLFSYLCKRSLYRFPPARIGRGWRPLARAELVRHASQTWNSFGNGRGHIFIWFCFRCSHCNRVSIFPSPNQYWERYHCGVCDRDGTFSAGWYYLAINPWSFTRFNVVRGIGHGEQLV